MRRSWTRGQNAAACEQKGVMWPWHPAQGDWHRKRATDLPIGYSADSRRSPNRSAADYQAFFLQGCGTAPHFEADGLTICTSKFQDAAKLPESSRRGAGPRLSQPELVVSFLLAIKTQRQTETRRTAETFCCCSSRCPLHESRKTSSDPPGNSQISEDVDDQPPKPTGLYFVQGKGPAFSSLSLAHAEWEKRQPQSVALTVTPAEQVCRD